MKKFMILIAATAMAITPITASAARVFVGGPVFGAGFYGPYAGSYWGPGYGWGPGFGYRTTLGEVKIETKSKDGEVFINGAFAGVTKNAKNMHLQPGSYSIEVRQAGQPVLNQQVFVTAGQTLHLHPAI